MVVEHTGSGERLAIVVEDLPVAMALVTRDGTVVDVTGDGQSTNTERPLTDFIGANVFDLVADQPEAADALRRGLGGEPIEYLSILEGVTWLTRVRPLRDGAVLVAMDVTRQVEAEAARARFEALVERAFDGSAVIAPDGTLMYLSAAALGLLGFDAEQLLGRNALELVHTDDVPAIEEALTQGAGADHEGPTVECRIVRADGEVRWVEAAVTNRLADPAIRGMVLNFRDITERKQVQAELERREAYYRGIVETAQEGVWLVAPDGATLYANARMAELLGTDVDCMPGRSVFEFLPADARPHWERNLALRREGASERFEWCLTRPDGTERWLEVAASPMLDRDGELIGAVAMVADIDERKRSELTLARLALQDGLTGLANRNLLLDHLQGALHRSERTGRGRAVAVLFIDLDNFKLVNDSAGHDAGDQLLCAVARRLEQVVRRGDTVARLGGDEFVIIAENLEDGHAFCLAQRVREVLASPIALGLQEVFVGASIGIALSPADDAGELLRRADTAMYRAKERGRGRIELFDEALLESAVARFRLHTDLREAISKGQLDVHYQPITRLRDGQFRGVEALVRWQHPVHGFVGPDQFIPVAEQAGLIREIDLRVLDQACGDIRMWGEELPDPPALAVNLSVRHLGDAAFVDDVLGTLDRTGLDASLLCLELTESALMDDAEQALVALEALHRHGVRFAIDDFGTGYSSLVYLRRFPIEEIKIDRSFISGLPDDIEDLAIVASIVSLAAAVGARTVAEGVETPEQLATLRDLGCDLGQGYYWQRPAPGDVVRGLF